MLRFLRFFFRRFNPRLSKFNEMAEKFQGEISISLFARIILHIWIFRKWKYLSLKPTLYNFLQASLLKRSKIDWLRNTKREIPSLLTLRRVCQHFCPSLDIKADILGVRNETHVRKMKAEETLPVNGNEDRIPFRSIVARRGRKRPVACDRRMKIGNRAHSTVLCKYASYSRFTIVETSCVDGGGEKSIASPGPFLIPRLLFVRGGTHSPGLSDKRARQAAEFLARYRRSTLDVSGAGTLKFRREEASRQEPVLFFPGTCFPFSETKRTSAPLSCVNSNFPRTGFYLFNGPADQNIEIGQIQLSKFAIIILATLRDFFFLLKS